MEKQRESGALLPSSDEPAIRWQDQLIGRLLDARPEPLVPLSSLAGRTTLFHYTKVDGLKGIVEKNCVWASAASYLNDASEVEYGCELLRDVFSEWEKAKNIVADTLEADIIGSLRRSLENPISKFERAMTIYVACFCEDGNLLSQWRAYGEAGGYSVGFSLFGRGLASIGPAALRTMKPEDEGYRASIVKVIYDKKEQARRLERVLDATLPAVKQPDLQAEADKSGEEGMNVYARLSLILIEDFLMEEIVSFKNAAFAEEKEWRIVVRPTFTRKHLVLGRKDPAISLRTARGLMIPYLKLIPTDTQLPIESVRFGPSLDKTRAGNSIKVLLSQNEYKNVRIDGSAIPVVL